MRPRIPKEEFISRIQRTQEVMRQQGLDLLLCYANEAEPATTGPPSKQRVY